MEASHKRQFNVIVHPDCGPGRPGARARRPGPRHQGPHGPPRQVAMSGHCFESVNEGGEEGLPVLGRHDVVDDRVDCRIQIEKYPRDVKKFLIKNHLNIIRLE